MSAISPTEVHSNHIEYKRCLIPNEVFEIFNELIQKNYSLVSRSSRVIQEDVVQGIVACLPVSRESIFAAGWLDVEDIYRAQKWDVEYDKPGYNESYSAHYIFKSSSNQ